jgi:hypothetical protein
MRKSVYSVRMVLFFIVFVTLTAPIYSRSRKLPPMNRDFFFYMAGTILVLLIYSLRTRSLIWPLWTGLRKQARCLSAAQIVLFLSGFVLGEKIFVGGFFTWQIPLTLFVLAMILLLPGVYCQRELDPERYWSRAIRNSLLSMALGFLFIPGFAIVYYLTLALTSFIRN